MFMHKLHTWYSVPSVYTYYSNTYLTYFYTYISHRHSTDATKTAIPSYVYTGYDVRQIALEVSRLKILLIFTILMYYTAYMIPYHTHSHISYINHSFEMLLYCYIHLSLYIYIYIYIVYII